MRDVLLKKERQNAYHGALFLLMVFILFLLTGCGAMSSPVGQGLIMTNVRGPVTATGNSDATKVGSASCVNVLGLVAAGDSSISSAMKRGNITRIHHVDNQVFSILFFFTRHTTVVYGE